MGIQISKTGQTYKESEPDQGSLPSTPILTPKNRVSSELDPRSPTANIIRTPIQLSNVVNKSNTPVIGEINTSFEAHTDEDNSYENTNVAFDPRSPSVDFTRTPIVVEKSSIKIRNKNLDNVRKMTVEFSPVKQNCNPSEIEKPTKRPILIESSPITRKNEQVEKHRSYLGLLETNLDFIETDLDLVEKNKKNSSNSTENSNVEPVEKSSEVGIFENIQVNISEDKLSQIEEEIKEFIAVTVDPTIELNKTGIEVIVEQEVAKTPVKTPQKREDIVNTVLEFDKKITNLIFEDQSVQLSSPKQNKLKDNNRTPLGDRNRIATTRPKAAASKLKVYDKPRSDYAVSKIPVFKDKKSKNVQCENTLPTVKKENRIKKSQWDTDKTLII